MQYQYWLSNIEGIGSITIQKVMKYVGSAEELYFLPVELFEQMTEVGYAERRKIIESKKFWDLEGMWEKFQMKGIAFV